MYETFKDKLIRNILSYTLTRKNGAVLILITEENNALKRLL